MIYIGAHVSVAKGWEAMGKTTLSIGGDTFAFFLRSPRGGAAKPVVPEDAAALRTIMREHDFGPIVAHAPYTMNLCAVKEYVVKHAEDVFQGDLQKDAYGFYNYASGMFDFLTMLADRYHNLPVIITENGFAQKREPEEPQDLEPLRQDPARIAYMCEHIRTCGRLLRAGVNLKGYFYWAITDTWEGAQGYTCPMGLVGVNFDTLERQKRDSFYYYQSVIKNNMVD